MDVVCHETPRERAAAVTRALLAHEVQVGLAIGVALEDVDGPHAALDNVVGVARDNEPGEPGHAVRLCQSGGRVKGYCGRCPRNPLTNETVTGSGVSFSSGRRDGRRRRCGEAHPQRLTSRA